MQLYVVGRANPAYARNWRVSRFHAYVYHGRPASRRSIEQPTPVITNTVRESLVVERSGRFVPPVALYSNDLVVHAPLMDELRRLQNTEFLPVQFQKLVDLAMPPLGDFSAVGSFDEAGDYRHLDLLPDVPEFHRIDGQFFHVLCANIHDVIEEYDDIVDLTPDFGNYTGCRKRTLKVSKKFSEQYPFVYSGPLVIREDAFKVLASSLDLDYFAVAVVDV